MSGTGEHERGPGDCEEAVATGETRPAPFVDETGETGVPSRANVTNRPHTEVASVTTMVTGEHGVPDTANEKNNTEPSVMMPGENGPNAAEKGFNVAAVPMRRAMGPIPAPGLPSWW